MLLIMACGIAHGRTSRTYVDYDGGDGVAKDGGPTPANKLTGTCTLGL